MGKPIDRLSRWFRHIAKDIYALEGDVKNPPKVFIDDIEGFVYTQTSNTPYHEFYTKKEINDGQGFDYTRSKKPI